MPCSSRYCRSILGISTEAMGYVCWCFGTFCPLLFFHSNNLAYILFLAFQLPVFREYPSRLLKKLAGQLHVWTAGSFVYLIDLFWYQMVFCMQRSVRNILHLGCYSGLRLMLFVNYIIVLST